MSPDGVWLKTTKLILEVNNSFIDAAWCHHSIDYAFVNKLQCCYIYTWEIFEIVLRNWCPWLTRISIDWASWKIKLLCHVHLNYTHDTWFIVSYYISNSFSWLLTILLLCEFFSHAIGTEFISAEIYVIIVSF